MNMLYIVFFLFFLLNSYSNVIRAQDLRISIAQLPIVAESINKGVFVDLAKEIAKEYKDGKVTIEVSPFSRSVLKVAAGLADMHLPYIRSEISEKELKKINLEYSKVHLNKTPFVLYFRSDNNLVNNWVDNNFPDQLPGSLKIITDAQHVIFFDTNWIYGMVCLECMVRMVDTGRLDGVIFAGIEIDHILNKNKFFNFSSIVYKNFDSSPVFRATPEGRILNEKVSKIITKLKDDGRLTKIMRPYSDYYAARFGLEVMY